VAAVQSQHSPERAAEVLLAMEQDALARLMAEPAGPIYQPPPGRAGLRPLSPARGGSGAE
jgi:hypothetical protein